MKARPSAEATLGFLAVVYVPHVSGSTKVSNCISFFRWLAMNHNRKGREGLGVTRDISTAGTFIEAPEGPAVGTRVKVVVTIASDVKNEMQLRLCGSRDVRHIDNGKEAQSGFGAWVGFHTDGAGSAEERQTSARCSSCPKDV